MTWPSDALRAIRLFTSKVADAVLEGRQAFEQAQLAEQKTAEELAAEAAATGVEYVDTSAYEAYEKPEGHFVDQDLEGAAPEESFVIDEMVPPEVKDSE